MSWTKQLTPKLHSLRGRLALFYAAMTTCVLLLFATMIYGTAVFIEEQEDEPIIEKQRELSAFRHLLFLSLAAAIPLSVVLSTLGSSLMTRRTVKALSDLVEVASKVGPDQLSHRLKEHPATDAEIQRLIHVLNQMLDRVDRCVTSLRRFTSDAAHELRTPLADLMGRLEISLRRPRDKEALRLTMEETLEGLGRLMRLTEILLTLARTDSGELPVSKRAHLLGPLLDEVLGLYEGVAAESAVLLRVECDPRLHLETDALLFHRALANLVENAIKFSPPGGMVVVRAEPTEPADPTREGSDKELQVVVTDSGPGLGDEDPERLFARFYRSPSHRGRIDGFGLGLALTRSFVAALGGTVELRSTPHGTTATVRLPQPVH